MENTSRELFKKITQVNSTIDQLHYNLTDNTIHKRTHLSSPNRTRQEEASSLLQYLQPLAIRHGKSIVSASTCTEHIYIMQEFLYHSKTPHKHYCISNIIRELKTKKKFTNTVTDLTMLIRGKKFKLIRCQNFPN